MANQTFAAVVGKWCEKVVEAQEAVFREAAQELVRQLDEQLVSMVYDTPETPNYRRTGFLRASLVASTQAMPQLIRDNPGTPVNADFGDVILVINDVDVGNEVLYLGVTARYGAFVHNGSNGRAPRPWVSLTAQRWPEIVSAAAARVKQRFGL